MTTQLPPPGWYQDPSGQPGLRYFDGRDWTSHYANGSQPSRQPSAQYPQSHVLQPHGQQKANANRNMWIAIGLAALLGAAILVAIGLNYLSDPMRDASYRQGYQVGFEDAGDEAARSGGADAWCASMADLAKRSSDKSWVDEPKFKEGCQAGWAHHDHQ